MKLKTALTASALAVSGCAQMSEDIGSAYVSPLAFSSYSCPQLRSEADRISARAVDLAGVQNRRATSDAVATGVALVYFWPAALLIRGDSHTAPELAELRGRMEAIEQVSAARGCAVSYRKPLSLDQIELGMK